MKRELKKLNNTILTFSKCNEEILKQLKGNNNEN